MPTEQQPPRKPFSFGRRRLLGGGLVLVGATLADLAWPLPSLGQVTAPSAELWIRRREDQLNIRLDLYALVIGDQQIERDPDAPAGAVAAVVVNFPPQHVLEEAFLQSDPALDPTNPTFAGISLGVRARLAAESRLGFRIPDDVDTIPLSREAAFDWEAWAAQLVGAASAPGEIPRRPTTTDTAIELPWWLVLSPDDSSGWAHASAPVDLGGPRTELWHTRLAQRSPSGLVEGGTRPVRAVWAYDDGLRQHLQGDQLPSVGPFTGGRAAMEPRDRGDIVLSTAGWTDTEYSRTPEPVQASRLALSSFGGWLDSNGAWDDDAATSLASWRHIATLGRDHYVRIVRRGFMFPFGHPASLVRVTERRFETLDVEGEARQVALLRQKFFIVIRKARVRYGSAAPFGGFATPFDQVDFQTLTTPSIDAPSDDLLDLQGQGPGTPPDNPENIFVPLIDGLAFRFVVDARDHGGTRHTFSTAAAFVESDQAVVPEVITRLIDRWEDLDPDGPLRRSDTQGRRIMLASPSAEKPGNSEAIVNALSWSGTPAPSSGPTDPAFVPRLSIARIVPEAAEAMLGGPVGSSVPMGYTDTYLNAGGFLGGPLDDAGAFMAFAEGLGEQAPGLDFAGSGKSDRSGGSISPGMAIRSLSRAVGAAGDPSTLLPTGGINLSSLFAELGSFLGNTLLENVLPTDVSLEDGPFALESVREGNTVTSRMTVKTDLRDWPTDAPVFKRTQPGTPARLFMEVTNVVPINAELSATTDIVGEVTSFSIVLFGPVPFIQVDVSALTFEARPGQSPTVDPGIIDVFPPEGSPLQFVDKILSLLPSDIFGFDVDISATHVTAALAITFPTITIGALQIHEPNLSVGVTIPFTGDPFRFRFALGRRDKPIAVTYLALGGGFWLEIEVTGKSVVMLTAGIEVRATAEISVGPFKAKGSLAIGIFFSIETIGGERSATLGGYVRAEVEVNVLILGVHVTVELILTYDIDNNQATGRATIEIEVEIAFFGFSWSIEVERKLGGSGAGGGGGGRRLPGPDAAAFLGTGSTPRFGDTMAAEDWATYCNTFAPAA